MCVCIQIEMEKVRRAEASVYKSDNKEASTNNNDRYFKLASYIANV